MQKIAEYCKRDSHLCIPLSRVQKMSVKCENLHVVSKYFFKTITEIKSNRTQ